MSRCLASLLHCCGLLIISFTIYVIYAADQGTLPANITRLYQFPGGDKAGHVVIFCILAFAVNALLYPRRIHFCGKTIQTGTLLLFLIISLEELSQLFIASRTFDLMDLACSYLGLALGTISLTQFKKHTCASMKDGKHDR